MEGELAPSSGFHLSSTSPPTTAPSSAPMSIGIPLNVNLFTSISSPTSNIQQQFLSAPPTSHQFIGSVSPLLAGGLLEKQIRRGPGRPRKDGSGPFIKKSLSTGSPKMTRGLGSSTSGGSIPRVRIKSQHQLTFRGNSAAPAPVRNRPGFSSPFPSSSVGAPLTTHQQRMTTGCYSSTSSPSADSSSPGTPSLVDSSNASVDVSFESPFSNSQYASGAVLQNSSQRCAFCYLTAASLLGQGDWLRLDPTPGFNGYLMQVKKESVANNPSSPSTAESSDPSSNQNDPNLTLRISLKHSRVVRAKKKFDNYIMDEEDVFDEIENVGLPDEIEPTDIFERTGHFYAHHCCVSWSDNMIQLDSGAFEHVDSVVIKSMTVRCTCCGRFGASISCRAKNCSKIYHYPCATAVGAFQDIKSVAMFCPDHVDQALITTGIKTQCNNCELTKDLRELLFCTSCGEHFHSYCLDPPVQTVVSVRAGWQCPDCKSCQHCKSTNDDSKMLVCDVCDKGYHTYCVQPVLTTVPKHGWKCKNCRRCTDCRSRTPGSGPSSRWHMNYTICDSCYQQRNKGLACPLCGKAYRHCKQKTMRECIQCRKHVHRDCDKLAEEPNHYICKLCRESPATGSGDQQPLFERSNQSSVYSADENEEELSNFLKNEVSEAFSDTESPFSVSDLDFSTMDPGNIEWPFGGVEDADYSSAISVNEKTSSVSTISKKLSSGSASTKQRMPASYRRSRSSGSLTVGVGGAVGRPPAGQSGEKRRGSKSKGTTNAARTAMQTLTAMLSNQNVSLKHKDDDEYIHTIVVTSSTDDFVFCQDMCVICGSLGKGSESRLIACMQCGQCYHTYCAGVKLNSVIVRRGWRCLDCTVCEGCGRISDEQHLLLCDECDVSIHTYCLDPPLDCIPAGAWRCKWCSCCLICDGPLTSTGVELMENYKICGSCASLSCCSLCRINYRDSDLIIKCNKCNKWSHGKCNGLSSEESLDKASDASFTCLSCRPGYQQTFASAQQDVVEKTSEYSQYLDGIALTKSGVSTVSWKPKFLPPRTCMMALSSSSQCIEDVIDSVTALVKRKLPDEPSWEDHMDESFDGLSVELNFDGSGNVGHGGGLLDQSGQISPGEKQKKIKARKNVKIGIGGFVARGNRQKVSNEKNMFSNEDGATCFDTPLQEMYNETSSTIQSSNNYGTALESVEDPNGDKQPKKRKRTKKRVGYLDDNYPNYIQEAFFGSLTEKHQPSTSVFDTAGAVVLDEQKSALISQSSFNNSEISVDVMKTLEKKSQSHSVARRPPASASVHHDSNINEGFDDIGEDQDIFPANLQSSSDFSNILDMLMREDIDVSQDASAKMRHSPEDKNLESLDTFDNNAFVGISGMDPAEMDRIMDNMFTSELRGGGDGGGGSSVVVVPGVQQQTQQQHVVARVPPYQQHHDMQHQQHPSQQQQHYVAARNAQDLAQHQQQQQATPQPLPTHFIQQTPLTPMVDYGQDSTSFFASHGPDQMHLPPEMTHRVTMHQTPDTTGVATIKRESPAPPGGDLKSSMERWEQDEPLGRQATTAAVLYVNLSHPDLKTKYPSWNERAKQIAKLWRLLSPEQRQRFVLMARENRTTSRQVAKGKKGPSSKSVDSSGSRSVETKLPITPTTPIQSYPPEYLSSQQSYSSSSATGATSVVEYSAVENQPSKNSPYCSMQSGGGNADVRQWNQTQSLLLDDLVEMERREQFSRTISLPGGGMQQPPLPPTMIAPQQQQQRWVGGPPQDHVVPPAYIQQQQQQQPHMRQQGMMPPATMNVVSTPPFQASAVAGQQSAVAGGPPTGAGPLPLPPRDFYLENELVKNQQDYENQQKLLENQLSQLRRNKKNTASKQRQMRKNNVEPPEEDKTNLARLSKEISDRQKQLEQIKKQAKANNTQMQDYQQKHGLVPPTAPQSQPPIPQQVGGGPPFSTVRPPMSPGFNNVAAAGGQRPPQPHLPVQRPPFAAAAPPGVGFPQRVVCAPTGDPYVEGYVERRFNRMLPPQATSMTQAFHHEPPAPQFVSHFAAPPGGGGGLMGVSPYGAVGSAGGAPPLSAPADASAAVPFLTPVQQQIAPVVPFPQVACESAEPKKKKKKYRKKKQDANASGQSDASGLYSPRSSFSSGTVKSAQFLDIPAPKPTASLMQFDAKSSYQTSSFASSSVVNAPSGSNVLSLGGVTVTLPVVTGPSPFVDIQESGQKSNRFVSTAKASGVVVCKTEMTSCSVSIGGSGCVAMPMQIDDLEPFYETDVVDIVRNLMDRVSVAVDGEDSAENRLLKTLLQSSPTTSRDCEDEKKVSLQQTKGPGKRLNSCSSAQGSPRKRPRKNTKLKATESSPNDDFTVFLEQLGSQMKQLSALPVREPLPRPDPLLCTLSGVSVLADKPSKPIISGETVGRYKLTFMPDYYNETFGLPGKPPLSAIVPAPIVASQQQSANAAQYSAGALSSQPFGRGAPPIVNNVPLDHHYRQPPVAMHPSLLMNNEKASELVLDSRSESPLELIYGTLPDPEEEVVPTYPALKPNLPSDGRLSPNFRLMAHVPMRSTPPDPPLGSLMERMVPQSLTHAQQQADTVGVTLTLDVEASKNVKNVLRGLALLLNIEVPKHFDIQIDTPPHTPEKAALREFVEAQQMFCRRCDTVIQQTMVKKKFAELGLTPKDDDNDEVLFCSANCYLQFVTNARASSPKDLTSDKTSIGRKPTSEPPCLAEPPPPRSTIDEAVDSVRGRKETSPPTVDVLDESKLDEIIRSVVGAPFPYGGATREEVFHVKDLPRLTSSGAESESLHGHGKHPDRQWKGSKWLSWNTSMRSKVTSQLIKDVEQFWLQMSSMLFFPAVFPADNRVCDLCSRVGDAPTEASGRLLNYDAGRWVHVNCALWSAEVYETTDGGLVNVEQAVRRSAITHCFRCHGIGATVPCYKLRCGTTFHFQCALDFQCIFMKDKTMFCPEHVPNSNESVLSNLSVLRKVFIGRDENRLLAKLYQQGYTGQLGLRVGSLIFKHIGQLLPHQLKQFSTKDYIFPNGYEINRIYWSAKNVKRRSLYHCIIGDNDSLPEFSLTYTESEFSEISVKSSSATEVWSNALQSIEQMRVAEKMLKLFPRYLPGEMLFGLMEPCVQKMIESLPGVDSLVSYEFKFGRHPLMDLPLAVNPSGCARSEPRFRTYIKRPHTLTASTQHSVHSLLALSGISLESAMFSYGSGRQSLQSKWSQYRKMKTDWKNTVYLARSKIQGLGLYAKRDIEMNAMVIEYIGQIIRNEVAERREKEYQEHSRGIYMFRIDNERVIDATVTGGPARYVNHSCDPNCVAELFEFDREAKIIIMSCRPISIGEELTYDYQFDFEDDSNKIPCLCGAPHCRKWMN